jgi:RES domain-containing protein
LHLGLGVERASGRWHTVRSGKPVVYLAEHSALALVESLANLTDSAASLPRKYQLIKVEVPAPILAGEVEESALPDLWRKDFETSRKIGDAWLAEAKSALLRVPSAPSPESWTYLLNPLHSDARQILRRQADPDRMVPLDRLR